MVEQIAVQSLLNEKFMEFKFKNSRSSLRAFSKKIGVPVGSLTHIINGKRNISKAMAEKITRRLLLDPQKRLEILKLFPEKLRRPSKTLDHGSDLSSDQNKRESQRYLQLSAAHFKLVSEWEHFAVLSLIRCHDFDGKVGSIAGRLGISSTRSKQVVKRLIDIGVCSIDGNNNLRRAKKRFKTSDGVSDISIQKSHEQTLLMAIDSLFRDDVQIRDFTSVTLPINIEKLALAKEKIRQLQDELISILESGNRTEVFQLAIQLFPITRSPKIRGHQI